MKSDELLLQFDNDRKSQSGVYVSDVRSLALKLYGEDTEILKMI